MIIESQWINQPSIKYADHIAREEALREYDNDLLDVACELVDEGCPPEYALRAASFILQMA